ncbi:MAG: CorA family divalent cation transporter [Acidimicrobiia bacterium]
MLWADVDIESIDGLDKLWHELDIVDLVAGLAETGERPGLVQHDGLLQINVTALDPGFEPMALHCLVGENWVVTLHAGTLDLVDEFNKPFNGETRLGELDGPAFLSVVLDWQVSGYFKVIEKLQSDIDHLDEELLQQFPDEVGLLHRLQGLRRRVRELWYTLGSHREVFDLLSHPESKTVLGSETAPNYQRLSERLQQAMDAVDTTRDMIVGSFDIFMTRTAQATNDIMKRLTTISLLLLPAVVIAGIMGMNFKVGIFERPWMFWVTLGLMATLATLTLLVAKRQKWF